jgi:cell division septation protein DedD
VRTASLIIVANILSFMLGVVITLWLTNVWFALSPAQPVTPVAETLPKLSVPPTGTVTQVVPQFRTGASKSPSDNEKTKTAEPPRAAEPPAAATPSAASSASRLPAAAASSAAILPQAGPANAVAPATVAETQGQGGGSFMLWFGAFAEPGNAALVQKALQKYGYTAAVVPYSVGGKVLRLVQVAGFVDRNAADEAAVSVQRQAGIGALMTNSTLQ